MRKGEVKTGRKQSPESRMVGEITRNLTRAESQIARLERQVENYERAIESWKERCQRYSERLSFSMNLVYLLLIVLKDRKISVPRNTQNRIDEMKSWTFD